MPTSAHYHHRGSVGARGRPCISDALTCKLAIKVGLVDMVSDLPHYSDIEGLPETITCPKCKRTSANANDIAQGWCGNCKAYTSDPQSDDVRRRVAARYTPNRQRGPADGSDYLPWETVGQWHPQAPDELCPCRSRRDARHVALVQCNPSVIHTVSSRSKKSHAPRFVSSGVVATLSKMPDDELHEPGFKIRLINPNSQHQYPAKTFRMPDRLDAPPMLSEGGWLACEQCSALIEADDRVLLSRQVPARLAAFHRELINRGGFMTDQGEDVFEFLVSIISNAHAPRDRRPFDVALLQLDDTTLAWRRYLAITANHLLRLALVGNPAPIAKRMAKRLRSPEIGDFVYESSTLWRDEDSNHKGIGLLEKVESHPERTYHIRYGPEPDDVCKWTNAAVLVIPLDPSFASPVGSRDGTGVSFKRDDLIDAIADQGWHLQVNEGDLKP